ncbi:MAG: holo-ACP synthase [Bowdeniella nasicola]|nr:holo-ACP synthase [Bowdeniella nasicola]
MTVRGIGVDLVDVDRFAATLERNARLGPALFGAAERAGPARTLAGRFAAKEALAKALGSPGGMRWHDCEVSTLPSGQPTFTLRGTVKETATRLGIQTVHLSISHDGGFAIAMVVAEG